MDHVDPVLPLPAAESSLGGATSALYETASRTALEALEQAITAARAGGSLAEIATQAKNLADASVRAAAQMREQLTAMEQLQRMAELVGG